MQKTPNTLSNSLVRHPPKVGGSETVNGDFLKKGEVILAKVVSRSVKGKVILQMGEMKLAAHTQSAVTEGSVVNFKVINAGKEPLLEIVPQSGKSQGKLEGGGQVLPKGVVKLLSLSSPLTLNVHTKIEAKVVSDSTHNGAVKLLIGQKVYEGVSANNLKAGQTVSLEVVSSGKEAQLRIVSSGEPKQAPESKSMPIKLLTPSVLKNIGSGELLVAKVVANNIKGEVTLQVGNKAIKVATERPVAKGQEIYLRVVKGGAQPQLEQVSIKAYLQQIRLGAYRSILPRQQNLVESLQKLISADQGKSDALPSNIKESLTALVKQLPTADKVSIAPQLRQALANTGLFTEAKLLAGLNVRSDLKMGLNHIVSLIRPILVERYGKGVKDSSKSVHISKQSGVSATQLNILGELLRSSDSAIAKIQSQQLASLPPDESSQQVWHYALPVHSGDKLDLFNIQIEREKAHDGDDESIPWAITLQMNLSPLGPMRVQLKLKGKVISTTFWAEEQSTLTLVNQNLPTLKGAFERAGLEVTDLRVLHGRITPVEEKVPKDLSLLNVKV